VGARPLQRRRAGAGAGRRRDRRRVSARRQRARSNARARWRGRDPDRGVRAEPVRAALRGAQSRVRWYGATPEAARAGPPAMFQGKDYRLYERLMRPFASVLAEDLAPGHICPEWVPYFVSPVVLDDARQLIEGRDPIWPHRRFCRPLAWAVVRHVDGGRSVGEIVAALSRERPNAGTAPVAAVLSQLHSEGFVLFKRPS
jgi:hypothetical protein